MSDLMNAKIAIQDLLLKTQELKMIRAYLTIEGFSNAIIEKAIKELDLKTKKSTGLTQVDILDFFEGDARTEHDLYTLVFERGVTNECRWVKDRNKIRLLTIAIYKKGGYEFTEVPASKELIAKLAYRVANKIDAKGAQEAPEEEPSAETEDDTAKQKAWDDLKKAQATWAKGKKPRKNAFHPDKVAKFGDEYLTKAYNDFQAEMNNAA